MIPQALQSSGATGYRTGKRWTYRSLALLAASASGILAWAAKDFFLKMPDGTKDLDRIAAHLFPWLDTFLSTARFGVFELCLLAIPASALLVLVLGRLAEWISRKLDPQDHGWTSIAWTIRSTPGIVLWLMVFAMLGYAAEYLGPGSWDETFIGLAVVCALVVGLAAANRANVLGAKPPLFWRPAWPGLAAVLMALLWLISMWFVSLVEPAFDAWLDSQGLGWRVTAGLIGLVLSFAWVVPRSIVLFVWLNRRPAPTFGTAFSRACSAQALGPLLASDLRWFAITLALAWPVLVCSLLATYYIPQLEELAQRGGQQLAEPMVAFVRAYRWFAGYGWPFLAPAFLWLFVVLNARIYSTSGMLEAQAGDPSGLRSSSQSPAQSLASS